MPEAASPPASASADGPVPITVAPAPVLHLSSREVPPGGLNFKILALAERAPRDAWVGPFNSIHDLRGEVNKRERANGLALSTETAIEDQVCQRLPPGYCRDAGERATTRPGSLSLGLADVISGTRALARWFLHGSVPVDETVRRSRICNECPENLPILGCTGCAATSLHAVMNAIVVKPLPSDALLQSCGICRCSLKAKTRMRLDDLLPNMTVEQKARLPEKCWLIAELSARDSDPRV